MRTSLPAIVGNVYGRPQEGDVGHRGDKKIGVAEATPKRSF